MNNNFAFPILGIVTNNSCRSNQTSIMSNNYKQQKFKNIEKVKQYENQAHSKIIQDSNKNNFKDINSKNLNIYIESFENSKLIQNKLTRSS